jgi:hypothetical protein
VSAVFRQAAHLIKDKRSGFIDAFVRKKEEEAPMLALLIGATTLSIKTFSITTFSLKGLFSILGIYDTMRK